MKEINKEYLKKYFPIILGCVIGFIVVGICFNTKLFQYVKITESRYEVFDVIVHSDYFTEVLLIHEDNDDDYGFIRNKRFYIDIKNNAAKKVKIKCLYKDGKFQYFENPLEYEIIQ